MSNEIVLSASVRQNLLSLQSTADLLATTQNRLSTGNKVNTALDNPTNYFTAQALNNRSADISALLDGVNNGVQVLQAANTGITSLQKLVDSAKSVANQVLQSSVGYSQKSTVITAANAGATSDNILGAATYSDVTATAGAAQVTNQTAAYTSANALGTAIGVTATGAPTDNSETGSVTFSKPTPPATATGSSTLDPASGVDLSALDGKKLVVNGVNITFSSSATATSGTTGTGFTIGIGSGTTSTLSDITASIDAITGNSGTASSVVGGQLVLHTGTAADITLTGSDSGVATALGIADVARTGGTTDNSETGSVTFQDQNPPTTALSSTTLDATTGVDLSALAGKKLVINGVNISFSSSATTTTGSAGTGFTIGLGSGTSSTLGDIAASIDAITGNSGTASTVTGGQLVIHTGTAADISLTGSDSGVATALGLADVSRTPGAVTHPTADTSTTLSSLTTSLADGDSFTVNGKTIAFSTATATTSPPSATGGTVNLGTGTLSDVVAAINAVAGAGAASIDVNGKLSIDSGTASQLTIADGSNSNATAALGLTAVVTHGAYGTGGGSANTAVSGTTLLSGASSQSSNNLTSAFTTSDTIVVDGKTIAFASSGTTSTSATGGTINVATGTVQDVLDAIDKITGTYGTANHSTIDGTTGAISLHTGTTADLTLSGTGLAKLGLGSVPATTNRTASGGLTGLELTIGATGTGTATDITFGTGAGQVKSLNDLNARLQANNLMATIDNTGVITITTTNDAASSTIGTLGGSAVTTTGSPFHSVAAATSPTMDMNAQLARSSLVAQYNNILDQIKTTSQDASYNGIDLLNGDQLKLTFNETGTSTLKIQGVNFDYAGLGLNKLTGGTDFLDNSSAYKAITQLDNASNQLRSQASALGSNLSIVQIRQDFSKNLINVLQTGSSNLTLADTNEEAANSQALSTRQSIAVSALSLANQSQQSVLQLLK